MRDYVAFIVLLIGIVVAGDRCRSDEIDRKVKEVLSSKSQMQMASRYRALFNAAKAEGLSRLKRSEHDSIAIQAAWEVSLTIPEEQGRTPYQPDKAKLNWFLGFLEARARSPIPTWWREAVLDVEANSRGYFFLYPGTSTEAQLYHNVGMELVNAPVGSTVLKKGNSYVFQTGKDSVPLPDEILSKADDESLCGNVSGNFTAKHCFVAVHQDIGHSYVVACLNRMTGKTVWKSEVCGCWWSGGTGVFFHWATVVVSGDRVVIFGAARSGFYAHGFRSDNGDTLFQFSTGY